MGMSVIRFILCELRSFAKLTFIFGGFYGGLIAGISSQGQPLWYPVGCIVLMLASGLYAKWDLERLERER